MSHTPRTDAAAQSDALPRLGYGGHVADLARALERENASLLEALRAAERCLSTPHGERNKPSGTGELTTLRIIRAAIAKAAGETP